MNNKAEKENKQYTITLNERQRCQAMTGHIGDELVQYDNDTWQIIRK